jgi:sortase A
MSVVGTLPRPEQGRQRARHRAPRPRRQTGAAAASVVRGFGELLITLGVLLLLFCVYQLFYTNVPAKHAMAKETKKLQQQWKKQGPPAKGKPVATHAFKPGEGFAIIYIPRLGKHYEKPIVEGVTLDDLAKGVGHYPKSADPGEVGNFALAGHRATHGEPFAFLPRIRRGDAVVIETADSWYTYTVYDYQNHLRPTQTDVIAPVPRHPGRTPTEKLITLTTCNPRWASYERFVVWGKLTSVLKKTASSDALPPALRAA